MFYYFLVYGFSHGYTFDPKYSSALSSINQATYKQSGTEAQYNQVQSSAKSAGMKWANDNGLAAPGAAGVAVGSVFVNKKIQFKTYNVTFEATREQLKAVWKISF